MKEFETIEETVSRTPSKQAKGYFIMMVLMCSAITVVACRTIVFVPGAIVAWVIVLVGWKRSSKDFDYEFYRGNLQVYELLTGGKKRRCRLDVDLEKTIRVCHYSDYRDPVETKVKVEDYASGRPEARVYCVVIREKDYWRKVIIEPSDQMLEAFKNYAPNKVFL